MPKSLDAADVTVVRPPVVVTPLNDSIGDLDNNGPWLGGYDDGLDDTDNGSDTYDN